MGEGSEGVIHDLSYTDDDHITVYRYYSQRRPKLAEMRLFSRFILLIDVGFPANIKTANLSHA